MTAVTLVTTTLPLCETPERLVVVVVFLANGETGAVGSLENLRVGAVGADDRNRADFPMVRDGGTVSNDDNVSAASSSAAAAAVVVGLVAAGDPTVACSQSSISANVAADFVVHDEDGR